MPNLKWLHVTRGGVNAYLTPTVKSRPIQVTGSKGIHGTVFSEFALACIFMLAKKLPECIDAQKQKRWQKLAPFEIEGKTIGIVGLGTVGLELARKAKALSMRVLATKRTATAKPDYVDELGTAEFLLQLLMQSDFVVLLLASVPSTFNIIGENELRAMKKSAYLINLTGGRAIEEPLLVRALKERWIAGAVLDAFAKQPLAPGFGTMDFAQRHHHAANRRHHQPKVASAAAGLCRESAPLSRWRTPAKSSRQRIGLLK